MRLLFSFVLLLKILLQIIENLQYLRFILRVLYETMTK